MDDLPLLMALRVMGIAPAERVAVAAGACGDDGLRAVAACLARLTEAELVKERTGRMAGFTLTTPKGGEWLDKLLSGEGLRTNVTLVECYERFLGLNRRVLRVSSDWQLRRDGGVEMPNDHSDPSYDDQVIDRLAEIHDRAAACLDNVSACAPRYGPYRARLDDCVARLRAGDRAAFTDPLAESYHTVWFELHQDFLLTLGLEREE